MVQFHSLHRKSLSVLATFGLFGASVHAATKAAPQPLKTQHVVMIVWDGLRPDSVTQQNTPTLFQIAQGGVTFAHHHPVYPSSTEVNGTALSTGMFPEHGGIIGNREYRPDIDPLKSVAMEDPKTVRAGDKNGSYLLAPTVAEIVQAAHERTAVAGTKGVAILLDRSAVRDSDASKNSTDLYVGQTAASDAAAGDELSEIVKSQGDFPPTITFPNTKQDSWTTAALTQNLWKEGVPKYSALWLSDVDFSQHEASPGSPIALAALKSCDAQLATVLKALDAKGVRDTTTVFVVSDHGFSTIRRAIDIEGVLQKAGFTAQAKFDAPPQKGQIVVVALGSSVFFYVGEHDPIVTQKLVTFLQGQDFCGVLMTRLPAQGTFGLEQAGINSVGAPDVAMAFRWSAEANVFGIPGLVDADSKRKVAQGSHASLSAFDMHNTLIGNGPDFKSGFVDEMPTGNIDVAPTILNLLGLTSPQPVDGRVLNEAFLHPAAKPLKTEIGQYEATNSVGGGTYHQYLKWKKVGSSVYLDEGNAEITAAR